MAELETLQHDPRQAEVSSRVDLIVALPAPLGSDAMSAVVDELAAACRSISDGCEIVLALPAESGQDAPRPLETCGRATARNPAPRPLRYVNYAAPASDPSAMPWQAAASTMRAVFSMAVGMEARACTVLRPDSESAHASLATERLALLLGPALEGGFDLVLPLYTPAAFDDLLNKSVLYPLTCSLYGQRIHNPLANEMQASSRLFSSLSAGNGKDSSRQQGRLLWPGTIASNRNLKICQVHLGTRQPPSTEGIELSDALAQLAGPLFLDMEDNAAFWQRVRGSHEVPSFGAPQPSLPATEPVDALPMLEAFQLGVRNLREIWSRVLPPVTLLELKKLAQLTPDAFRFPDALWARIVYDFSLAHRLRNINRSHLFGALTPLYLGWAASYALEMSHPGVEGAAERVEKLARSYEAEKPYLLSRWRWPDRVHS
ncbi:MAG: hypothetical protein ACYDC6_10295 [Acidobacteriaceae bacterium]